MRHTEGACAQESGVLDVAKALKTSPVSSFLRPPWRTKPRLCNNS